MTDWPILAAILWWLAVVAAIVALISLPFVWRRGKRQLDEALAQVLDMRDAEESRSNVRTLSRWELARRMEKRNR